MYSQCPACLSVFSFDAKALTQAHGEVICGYCDTLFDALPSLTSQLPAEPFQQLPLTAHSEPPPRLELAVYRPQPHMVEPAAGVAASAAIEAKEDFSKWVFAPDFARAQQKRRARRWPWLLPIVLLAALLLVLLVWGKRDALIANPTSGGWLRRACATLHCQLPLVRDVRRLRLLARNVQAQPGASGMLLASVVVYNDAAFDQPYPVVVVALSDARGKRMALRRLRATEYLDDTRQRRRGLPAGSQTALVFELQDPGQRAVAFDFNVE